MWPLNKSLKTIGFLFIFPDYQALSHTPAFQPHPVNLQTTFHSFNSSFIHLFVHLIHVPWMCSLYPFMGFGG